MNTARKQISLAMAALLAASPCVAQRSDPEIARQIAAIPAIDNHAHPVLAPPADTSDREFDALQDFLFRYVAMECGRLGLAVHLHTLGGFGSYYSINGGNPLLLEPLFNDPRLRKTSFVLLHSDALTSASAPWRELPSGRDIPGSAAGRLREEAARPRRCTGAARTAERAVRKALFKGNRQNCRNKARMA